MDFRVSQRTWPEPKYLDHDIVWWEKGSKVSPFFKAELPAFSIEGLGETPHLAVVDLLRWFELDNADVYVRLIVKEEGWFVPGTEVFSYNGKERVSLRDYVDSLAAGAICVRGERIKSMPSEAGEASIGESYEDGELCSLDEFEVNFTTDKIN